MRIVRSLLGASLWWCIACSGSGTGRDATDAAAAGSTSHEAGGSAGTSDPTSGGKSSASGGKSSSGTTNSGGGKSGGTTSSGGSGGKSGGTTSSGGGGGKSGTGTTSNGGASSGGASNAGAPTLLGKPYDGGQYNLGPVDYDETQFHNACAPGTKYAASVRAVEGTLLAGLWNGIPDVSSYCDACIAVTTAKGKSAVLRVVTYGDTSTNSIDVSPDAYAILNSGEYPRSMTWQFTECPDTGSTIYEFQTGSNEWWTSFWLRNARLPIAKVEVMSKNHASYVTLQRGSDGTLTDASGFGQGPFTIRATSIDGKQLVDSFDWPSGGIAGAMLTGKGNF
jgi:expansin (peptidoglycan-binding protein)